MLNKFEPDEFRRKCHKLESFLDLYRSQNEYTDREWASVLAVCLLEIAKLQDNPHQGKLRMLNEISYIFLVDDEIDEEMEK